MKIRKNDTVQIMAGKDKGKKGKVLKTFEDKGKVLVEGVNVVKRHSKPGTITKEGGIIEFEKPIDVSNVMFYSEKEKRPVRVGYKIIDGKKIRISKASGQGLDVKVKKEAKKPAKKAPAKKKETKKVKKDK